jgi:hypothetical protein
MWTGLFCEDYSIFTRIDPSLDFFDAELERAGDSDIVPRLECVEDTGSGLVAHFGYQNANGLTVKVPYGSRNSFDRDHGHARPSAFSPGDSPYDFSVAFNAGQRLTWRLSPHGGPSTVVRADAASPRCAANDPAIQCAETCDAALAAECADGNARHGDCVNSCVGDSGIFEYYGCGPEWTAYLGCQAGLSSDASNWNCVNYGLTPTPMPPNCDGELEAIFSCLGY